MELLTKIQNRFRGLKQKWGSNSAKRKLWNAEFSEGRWDNIEDTSGDVVYRFIEKYAAGGSVLDLGCGSGNTSCELNLESYREYHGVDIADVAVEKARVRSKNLNRDTKNSYSCGDIEGYVPAKKYDVILFRESIYYVPSSRISATLNRYAQFLTDSGVMIIRMHDRKQGQAVMGLLEVAREPVEKHIPEAGPIVFVLR